MMNELADKLEQPGIKLMIPEETELQAKALRFAADMERLGSYDVEIKCLNPGDEWSITAWRRGMGIEVSFKCIYSAARKAVEALEGK